MKKYTPLCLIVLFFGAQVCRAQGWKWAATNTFSSFVGNVESSQLVVDKAANVYSASSVLTYHVGLLQGITTKYGPFGIYDSAAVGQMVVTKLNASGVFQWAKATQQTDAAALGMATDKAGNVYVFGVYDDAVCRIGGVTLNNATGEMMYFLMKFDPLGNVTWAKNVAETHGAVFAGEIIAHGGMGIDDADNVYVGGVFNQSSIAIGSFTLTNSSGEDDILIAKYNASGSVVWAKSYHNAADYLSAMAVSRHGDIYVSGNFISPSVTFGATTVAIVSTFGNFLARFDSSGTPKWAKSADNPLQQQNGMATDSACNVYVTGGFRFSPTSFGGHAITNVSPGTDDAYLVKYDSSGVVQWAKSAGSTGYDDGFSIATDKCGNVWLCGAVGTTSSGLTTTYSLHFGTDSVTGTGVVTDDPLFMARYDAAGNYISAFVVPSGGDDQAGLQVDNAGYLYLEGDWWRTTSSFGPVVLVDDSDAEHLLVGKYFYDTEHCLPTAVPEPSPLPVSFTLFPNPARQQCTISAEGFSGTAIANIYDLTGKWIRTVNLANGHATFSLSGINTGIYVCKVTTETATGTLKLIVE